MADRPGLFRRMFGIGSTKQAAEPIPGKPIRARIRRGAPKAVYDGASFSRRTAGWNRRGTDPNVELNPAVMIALRGVANDLVRNNPFAARAVSGIANNWVGPGITFQIFRNGKLDQDLTALARQHLESTKCDPEGRLNFYGQQHLAARTIVTSGEVLARRRWRRLSDGLPVPFQIQILEPDYINMMLTEPTENNGLRLQGIQLDQIGRRVGYWMYSRHPGSLLPSSLNTTMIPATEIAHCFKPLRPESMHGATWFSPVIVRMKDFGDYEDAQLVRQKIASCFAVFKTGVPDDQDPEDVDSNGNPVEVAGNAEMVEPGIIETLPDGADVKFASPPGVDGYEPYSKVSLRAIAAGLDVPYEVVTGDLSGVNFSSGRMGWLEFQRSITTWQWNVLIPQFCEPVGQWFLEAAKLKGVDVEGAYFVWTPPKREMIDPSTEVPAARDAVRAGQMSWSQMIRERGEDPETVAAEMEADNARFDKLGLVLDCDPRKVTQVGNSVLQSTPAQDAKPAKPPKAA